MTRTTATLPPPPPRTTTPTGGRLVRRSPGTPGRRRQRGRGGNNRGGFGRHPAGGWGLGGAHAGSGLRDLEEHRQGGRGTRSSRKSLLLGVWEAGCPIEAERELEKDRTLHLRACC